MTDLRAIAQQALEALEERYVGALRDKAMDALRAALAQPDKCGWVQEDESSDAWNTGCGRTFLINDGTPSENGMRYCCFCGKTLIGVPFEQENSGNE